MRVRSDYGRADRNVGDDMSLAGLKVHSCTPPGTSSLGVTSTPFSNDCQQRLIGWAGLRRLLTLRGPTSARFSGGRIRRGEAGEWRCAGYFRTNHMPGEFPLQVWMFVSEATGRAVRRYNEKLHRDF